jgi:hypothetical protein
MANSFVLIDESPSDEYDGFIPVIYDLLDLNESIPAVSRFNAVKITIDGRADGNLNWKLARIACINAIGRGLKILWNLDLGLPNRLQAPIADQTQFLALGLSLEHFRDTLWKEFKDHSIGLCIYQGSANFEAVFPKDVSHQNEHRFFYRDAIAEYLNLLAQRLPDGIPLFVIFDATTVSGRILLSELINKESFHRFQRFVTDGALLARSLTGKQLGSISRHPVTFVMETVTLGICLPPSEFQYDFSELEKALDHLTKNKIAFRLIPESSLTTEWDGLDQLLVISPCVSVQGLRRLKGFCAAGGNVLTLGGTLGLPSERPFSI